MDIGTRQRPKPKPHKILIIYDGNRPCVATFIDAAEEKQILQILKNKTRRVAQ